MVHTCPKDEELRAKIARWPRVLISIWETKESMPMVSSSRHGQFIAKIVNALHK